VGKGNQTNQVDRWLDCLEIGSTGYPIPLLYALGGIVNTSIDGN
jgi:hypothetical protein